MRFRSWSEFWWAVLYVVCVSAWVYWGALRKPETVVIPAGTLQAGQRVTWR